MRKEGGKRKSWKNRFFVLNDDTKRLTYFEKPGGEEKVRTSRTAPVQCSACTGRGCRGGKPACEAHVVTGSRTRDMGEGRAWSLTCIRTGGLYTSNGSKLLGSSLGATLIIK